MREIKNRPLVVILIEDETALYRLSEKFVYQIAVEQAANSEYKPSVKVFCPELIYNKHRDLLKDEPKILIDNNFDSYLANKKFSEDIFIIHNASRPIVPKSVYDLGIKRLLQGADALKQQHVVVDTLKEVDDQNFVLGTVDRELVKAVTTPEFYWVESIKEKSKVSEWFFEVNDESKKEFLYGELESTRIRSKKDLFLVKALIEQGQLI